MRLPRAVFNTPRLDANGNPITDPVGDAAALAGDVAAAAAGDPTAPFRAISDLESMAGSLIADINGGIQQGNVGAVNSSQNAVNVIQERYGITNTPPTGEYVYLWNQFDAIADAFATSPGTTYEGGLTVGRELPNIASLSADDPATIQKMAELSASLGISPP
jgi:hypothetical protein